MSAQQHQQLDLQHRMAIFEVDSVQLIVLLIIIFTLLELLLLNLLLLQILLQKLIAVEQLQQLAMF